jgi:hypothetical protein
MPALDGRLDLRRTLYRLHSRDVRPFNNSFSPPRVGPLCLPGALQNGGNRKVKLPSVSRSETKAPASRIDAVHMSPGECQSSPSII